MRVKQQNEGNRRKRSLDEGSRRKRSLDEDASSKRSVDESGKSNFITMVTRIVTMVTSGKSNIQILEFKSIGHPDGLQIIARKNNNENRIQTQTYVFDPVNACKILIMKKRAVVLGLALCVL